VEDEDTIVAEALFKASVVKVESTEVDDGAAYAGAYAADARVTRQERVMRRTEQAVQEAREKLQELRLKTELAKAQLEQLAQERRYWEVLQQNAIEVDD
jgi:hypothetical protein